ncbi:MAG: sugar phosphate isomerase/epimerase, partial [Thermoguttaceae bacterium]
MFKNLNVSALGVLGHPSELIELALTYGFASVDLNMVEFATRARLKGMAYARRLIQSAQLQVGTFSLPLQWDADDEIFREEMKKLPEYLDCAKALGCTRATVMVAPANDSRPYHENFEFHRHRLQDLGAAMAPAGVRLAVGFRAAECHRRDRVFQFLHDLDAVRLLLNMVAAPNVGLWLDVWEVVACGGSLESVRKMSPAGIVAVDVAEMPADATIPCEDDQLRLLPDAENGRIGVAGFLSELKEMGYDGPVTVRPSHGVFANHRREAVVRQAAESLNHVWPAAGLSSTTRPA